MMDINKSIEIMIQSGVSRGGVNKNLIIQDIWGIYHDNGIHVSIDKISRSVNETIDQLKNRKKIVLVNDIIYGV